MYDRRNLARRLFFGGIVLGHFAALWLALVEVSFLGLADGGSRLAGASAPWLLLADGLVVLLLGPAAGVVLGGVVAGVHLLATALAPQRRQEPVWKARIYLALAIPWAAWVAQRAFAGPRARALPHRSLLSLGLGLALLGGVWVTARVGTYLAGRLAAGHSGRAPRFVLPPALLCGAAVLYGADLLLLHRLYPFFHWSLAGAALLAAWLGAGATHLAFGRGLRRRTGRLARPSWVVTVAFVILALGLAGQRRVGRSHRLRGMLFERTAAAAKVLALSARLGVVPAPEPLRPTVGPSEPVAPARARAGARAAMRAHPGVLRGADVVLLTVDALRADRLGLMGYRRRVTGKTPVSITPNLDRLFRAGLVFRRAYTPTPRTSYALVSLLTGLPIHALLSQGVTRRWPTLPEVLRHRGGYHTAAFYPKAIFTIDAARFRPYAVEHLGFGAFHYEGHEVTAAERTDQVLAYLDGPGRHARPLLLWVHYFDPHEPYRLQPGYEAFGSSAQERYEAEVAYVDAQIGRLVDGIRKRRGRRVLVVLTADHGEEFGEHGGSNHGTTLFDEQVRVPLLLAGPGVPKRTVSHPVSLLGVAAFLTRLVGLVPPQPMGQWPLQTVERQHDWNADSAAVSELDDLAMVAAGHHKLIQDRRRGYLSLYDLAADPAEQRPLNVDVPGKARVRAARLLGLLEAFGSRLDRLRRASLSDGTGVLRLALASGDPARRRAAAWTLLRIAIEQGLHQEPNRPPRVAKAARGALGDSRMVAALRKRLRDPDIEVRHAALLTLCLAGRPPPRARALLHGLTRRWDLPARLVLGVGLALACLGDQGALRLLTPLLGRQAPVERRLAIVRLLGDPRIATPESVLALEQALADVELTLEALRALSRLARTAGTRAMARHSLPFVFAVLQGSAEHVGHRAAALRTLAALGTPAARALLGDWLTREPERGLRALGLALWVTWPGPMTPAGPAPAPSRLLLSAPMTRTPAPAAPAGLARGRPLALAGVLALPSPLLEAPAGACLSGKGCRLEPTPTGVTWPRPLRLGGSHLALWIVTEAEPDWPPEVTVQGEALALRPVPVFGQGAGGPADQVRLWRVELPPPVLERLGEKQVLRVTLADPSGKGIVVRALALLP